MAKNLELKIALKTSEYRPCFVKERKALFHRWSEMAKVLEPSITMGGHSGGQIKYTVGIIEYGDGVVTECYPYEIRFCDNKFNE